MASLSKRELRRGFTTGSCAAAAAKAAALGAISGVVPSQVEISLPNGRRVSFEVRDGEASGGTGNCSVVKDAGDDPDVTNALKIVARVTVIKSGTVSIYGGDGVGRATKPGLQVAVGEAGINPVPRAMIRREVEGVLPAGAGARVVISVPGGEKIAHKTFNPRLGIVGGISILGTTGIVEPKSVEACKSSLVCALDVARAEGFETVCLTPGNIGERGARMLGFLRDDQIVQTSNYVGFMMDEAIRRGFKHIILAGHPGKLAKLVQGHFMTHHSATKSACGVVVQIAREHGLSGRSLEEAVESPTVEGIIQIVKREARMDILNVLAQQIRRAAEDRLRRMADVRVFLFDMQGLKVGES
jgi:cobalt-precorrin-5B (C1)-methyltransferase